MAGGFRKAKSMTYLALPIVGGLKGPWRSTSTVCHSGAGSPVVWAWVGAARRRPRSQQYRWSGASTVGRPYIAWMVLIRFGAAWAKSWCDRSGVSSFKPGIKATVPRRTARAVWATDGPKPATTAPRTRVVTRCLTPLGDGREGATFRAAVPAARPTAVAAATFVVPESGAIASIASRATEAVGRRGSAGATGRVFSGSAPARG
mmetsp:Transcript_31022/g.99987  ORF Transcript_31022/g.99987 Transcript_31022/m.99987 type:complete len:204 (+) Transcript_31022:2985-3596(+)